MDTILEADVFGTRMVTFFVPAIIVVLAIPMILEKVPRNPLYGFRTSYTMSSDEVWYRANRISGIAMACAGLVWMILGFVVTNVRVVMWFGMAALIISVAISSWLTYRQ